VERCDGIWDWNDEDFAFQQEDHGAALRLIDSPLFDPESWLRRVAEIPPFAIRKPEHLPYHVRVRIEEMRQHYIFGSWIGFLATARALIEFALVDRSNRLGIDPYVYARRLKGLSELVEEARPNLGAMSTRLAAVVRAANSVLHPRRDDKLVTIPQLMEREARRGFEVCVALVERVY